MPSQASCITQAVSIRLRKMLLQMPGQPQKGRARWKPRAQRKRRGCTRMQSRGLTAVRLSRTRTAAPESTDPKKQATCGMAARQAALPCGLMLEPCGLMLEPCGLMLEKLCLQGQRLCSPRHFFSRNILCMQVQAWKLKWAWHDYLCTICVGCGNADGAWRRGCGK